ncbi:LOW QUALITY PROTEIN: FAST kinase domain-containing protein 5, mitochondrial [Amblyraja radiata]|uniref:LOW QUALITY PROTEIN: FAST kinase domain-containing protein 5, mitochondrial n=1 Tax=Amblyraja radiata TaxID=386614 RepID=UPI0014040956|nr:LOW QUALITY PROTEIN: FAST kinase domain-containing protein 5, mitochondrial [Amblyraja radiata]
MCGDSGRRGLRNLQSHPGALQYWREPSPGPPHFPDMATVKCWKLPRRIYIWRTYSKTSRCTEATRDEEKKVNESNKAGGVRFAGTNLSVPGTDSVRLDYKVCSLPAAYASIKIQAQQNISKETDDYRDTFPLLLEHVSSNVGIKQVRNTYMVTCSRQLSSVRNTLLNLSHSKANEEQLGDAQWHVTSKEKLDVDSVEVYDTKEDPRGFQKIGSAYKALCYCGSEQGEALSVQEGQKILSNVSIMKSSLTPECISDYLWQLSWLPADQHTQVKADSRFAMLCQFSLDIQEAFTLPQLLRILEGTVRLGVPPAHTFLKAYEAEFCRRVWDMDFDQLLFTADLWRCLGRSVPRYMGLLLSYADLRWKELTMPQLVQLLYIIGESRRAPPDLMQKLELLLSTHLDRMNMEDVGTACLGFFKSKNGFSEQLMQRIGDKVAAKMEDISNYSLVNVMKMFRYTHQSHLPFLERLGEVAAERIPTIGTQGVMHIVLACAALHYRDSRILDAVAAKVPSKVQHCRSKDVAKYLWSFAALNYEPNNAVDFFSSLTEQLHHKMQEFQRFPEHFLTSLLALAFTQRFPHDLIDIALSPQFVKLATEGSPFELKKDLFTLDGTVAIECPDYGGHRLPLLLQQEVTEMLWSFAKQDICVKPEMVEAATLLQIMLGGPQFVKNHMILPHTRSADLEVHFDPFGKPLPFNTVASRNEVQKLELKFNSVQVTDELISQIAKCRVSRSTLKDDPDSSGVGEDVDIVKTLHNTEDIKERNHVRLNIKQFRNDVALTNSLLSSLTNSNTVDKKTACQPKERSEIKKLAIQVSNRNHYCHSSNILLGLHSMKRRQLARVGYVVIELPYWEWVPLLKRTRSEKIAYLHQKLYNVLD